MDPESLHQPARRVPRDAPGDCVEPRMSLVDLRLHTVVTAPRPVLIDPDLSGWATASSSE